MLQLGSLAIQALTWFSMFVLTYVELTVYIREFRWFVRFGVMYVFVGHAVMVSLILPMEDYYDRFVFQFKKIMFRLLICTMKGNLALI